MSLLLRNYELPEKFESVVKCKEENNIRVKHLRKKGKEEGRILALKIDECTLKHPCGSGACRLCSRAFRVLIFNRTKRFLESCNLPCSLVTIVYFQDAMTDAQLAKMELASLKSRLRKQLHRAGLKSEVIGSFELDYQSDIELWMPHFHLLVFANRDEIEALRGPLLKKNFLKGLNRIFKPLRVDKIKEFDDLITYIYKFIWEDRKRFPIKKEYRKKKSGKEEYRTKKHRLSPERHAMALLALDRFGFNGLRFSSGVPRFRHPLCIENVSDG